MRKIGMSILISHPDKWSISDQIPLFRESGFDSFFLSCGVTSEFHRIPEWSELSRKHGLWFEAVHAPSGGMNSVWQEGEAGEDYLRMIRGLLTQCADGGVEKLVMHVSSGGAAPVSRMGLDRYRALEEYAEGLGVHLCFENGDVIPHLAAVLEEAGDFHGFCLDIGHHLCYAPREPLIQRFGHKLMYTHIHDNRGITRPGNPGGDMHLMPFDGNLDWNWFAEAIRNTGYMGTLNLELACHSCPAYGKMSYPEFVREANARITRFREMVETV